MSVGKWCTHINLNGGLYLVLAIISQAEKDKQDETLSIADRRDAALFLASSGTSGVYDMCVEYKKIYAIITEKRLQSIDNVYHL
jgi:hypothetical protein